MKTINTFLSLSLLLVFLGACCASRKITSVLNPSKEDLKKNYVQVLDVLHAIQYAVEKAYVIDPAYGSEVKSPKEDPNNALNHLSKVSIELANSFSKSVDGEVSFWVVKAGGAHSREKASTFTYTFEPIKKEDGSRNLLTSKDSAAMDKQSKQLQEALIALGTCLNKYKNASYALNEIELAVTFKITKTGSAGAEFNIGVVGIGTSGELELGNEHTMTLSFEIDQKKTTGEGHQASDQK